MGGDGNSCTIACQAESDSVVCFQTSPSGQDMAAILASIGKQYDTLEEDPWQDIEMAPWCYVHSSGVCNCYYKQYQEPNRCDKRQYASPYNRLCACGSSPAVLVYTDP